MIKFLIFVLSCLPLVAGTCPSGANYTSPAAPATLVTLASLGITNCVFVAANGADTNAGDSEASGHPWQHGPMMPNCSSACATFQNQAGGIPPGTGIIFRGGDTWHFGTATVPASGGVWNFNTGQFPMGTSGNPIYVGVDQGWFTGGSWARPILTGDNGVCSASSLGGGCNSAALGGGITQYYVTACAHQIGSTNDFFILDGLQYYIIDNFELTGLCQNHVGQPGHEDVYVSYGSLRNAITFSNLYMHAWTHTQFAGENGSGSCGGSVCFNIFMFQGSVTGSSVGENIYNVVVDGSDSDPQGAGLCYGGFYNVFQNIFRYTAQCIPTTLHLFHDNLYEFFFENGHSNVLESSNAENNGTNAVYNNVFRNLENSGGTGGVALWLFPSVGQTDYIFNNLGYAVGSIEYLNTGNSGSTLGNYTYFNNTWQTTPNQTVMNCQFMMGGSITDTNNHYIDDGTQYTSPCNNKSSSHVLLRTNAQATSDGYTSAETFAFSPPTSGSITVGAGISQAAYCTALSGAGLTAAASACQADTTYAVSYNTGNHTATFPARTALTRPATPSIGAYEFAGGTPPNPPTNLRTMVATERQMVVGFTVADATMAAVDVYTDAAMTQEIPDTAANNSANRSGAIVNGVVSGGAATGTDVQFPFGVLSANSALRQGTEYWVKVTNLIDMTTAVKQVGTAPFSTGNLYPEQPLANQNAWNGRAFPAVNWANRNQAYSDPTTGLILKPFTWIGDAWSQAVGTNDGYTQCTGACFTGIVPFDTPVTSTGTWTSPANAASSYNVTLYPTAPTMSYATCTGNCDIWLPLPSLIPAFSTWDLGTGSAYSAQVSVDYFTPYVWASCSGCTPTMTVSLTATPTGTPYHGCSFTTAALTGTKTGYLSPDPDPGFVSLCPGAPPIKGDIVTSSGMATVSGSSVTWTSGMYFQSTWPAGSAIKLNGTLCTIASVNSPTSITLTGACGSTGAFASRTLGVRVQANAGGGTLSLQAEYRIGLGNPFQVAETAGAGQLQCSQVPITISTDASGAAYSGFTRQGYPCWIDYDSNSAGVYYLWIPQDQNGLPLGESRIIGTTTVWTTFTSNGATFTAQQFDYDGPDPTTANKWYTHVSWSSGTTSLLLAATWDSTISGCNPLWKTWPGAQVYPKFGNNNAAGNAQVGVASCITYTNLTNPSTNKDTRSQIVTAYTALHPSFDFGGFSPGQVSFLNGVFVQCYVPGGDPQIGVCGTFDTTGTLTQVADTWSGDAPAGRWCPAHGHPYFTGSYYGLTCGFTGGHDASHPLFGPWQAAPVKVNLAGFGASTNWTSTTTLDNGTTNQYTCPTSAQMQALGVGSTLANSLVALGSSGNHCIQLEFNTEPCSSSPSTAVIWAGNTKTEAQQFPCAVNAAFSQLQTMQPGDDMTDSVGAGGENFIMLTKQITSPGGVCVTGAGNCIIDAWFIRGSGIWPQQQHPNYPTYNTHSNGWTAQMTPIQLNISGPIYSNSVGTHQWVQALNTLAASHGTNTQGSTTANANSLYIDTNGFVTFDVQANAALPGALMPNWPTGCQQCQQPLLPTYGSNAISFTNSTFIQMYCDGEDFAALVRPAAVCTRAFNPASGTQQEATIGLGTSGYTLTPVGGKTQTYTLANTYSAGAVNQKLTPLQGWAGVHMLQDYSSATANNLPDSGFGMCQSLVANECVTGSSPGTTYVSLPSAAGSTQGLIGQHTQNAPAVINASSVLGAFQEVPYGGPPDAIGLGQRNLGSCFGDVGAQWQFTDVKLDPTGQWYLGTRVYADGMATQVWACQRPSRVVDSINRTGYVNVPISTGGVSGDQVRVEFWVPEIGGVNGRAEHAFVPASGGAPFNWAHDTATYTSCSSGCTVQIPVIAGRLVYYALHRLNGSESTGPVAILGVP